MVYVDFATIRINTKYARSICMKIAVTGKGGVGKTFIAGTLACRFASSGMKTIAIDADTSPNLALTLGLSEEELERMVPIAENNSIIEEKTKTEYPGVYRLTFTVDDIISAQAVKTPCGVSLLVMGTVKTVGSGCACPAHSLVRTIVTHLVTERDEVVIMDMEAGIEHLGRGTAEFVDTMLVVTDAHQASLVTASRIVKMAREAGISRIALVANRVLGPDGEEKITTLAGSLNIPVPVIIPFDNQVLEAGMNGISPVGMKTPAPAVLADLQDWLMVGR